MLFPTRLTAALLMAALTIAPAAAETPAATPSAAPAAAAPDVKAGGAAVFLTFLNAPLKGDPIRHSPRLGLTINGGRTVRAVMDTGSTGIVVAARLIPDMDKLPVIGKGEQTYSSSGRIMRGKWVRVPVTIGGTNGGEVTTQPMPVLAVERVDCTPAARRCKPVIAPTNIAMIGVGFARQGSGAGAEIPQAGDPALQKGARARNPFLNIASTGQPGTTGTVRPAYLVTRRGVWLGLTPDLLDGFRFVKLEKNAATGDWSALPVCMSLDGRTPPACGTALIDTGVTVMYLTLPPAQLADRTQKAAKGQTLVPGAELKMSFGAPGTPLGYGFQVGDKTNPAAPEGVTLVNRTNRVFVNTSVRLLNAFDYLYDAQEGFVGLRPRQ
ncbi:hypothetical protein [Aquabacter cavernae]|uniref:hypothetical protein n=1 Tax=Aquabacter cavernae TaxID=2496029 RepID=UPI000F8D86A1|nr:hypothetical protein [Aquabacter cavernae]